MHPSVKDEFVPFQSIDVKDEKYNTILQEHGVRVLATFGKMVRRIDDEGTIVPMLRELGTRHGAIYNAKSSLIGVCIYLALVVLHHRCITMQSCHALPSGVTDNWSPLP